MLANALESVLRLCTHMVSRGDRKFVQAAARGGHRMCGSRVPNAVSGEDKWDAYGPSLKVLLLVWSNIASATSHHRQRRHAHGKFGSRETGSLTSHCSLIKSDFVPATTLPYTMCPNGIANDARTFSVFHSAKRIGFVSPGQSPGPRRRIPSAFTADDDSSINNVKDRLMLEATPANIARVALGISYLEPQLSRAPRGIPLLTGATPHKLA